MVDDIRREHEATLGLKEREAEELREKLSKMQAEREGELLEA